MLNLHHANTTHFIVPSLPQAVKGIVGWLMAKK